MPPKKAHKKGSKNSALNNPVKISADLEAVVGKGPMGRIDITRNLWKYIKAHKLQTQDAKGSNVMIKPDEKLKKILGSSNVHMMGLQGKISKHIS